MNSAFRAARGSALLALGFVVGTLTSPVASQPVAAGDYAVIQFLKTAPGKAQEFVQIERDIMRPMVLEAIRKGDISSWTVYEVSWPRGTERDYDFVSVTTYDTYAKSGANPLQGRATPELRQRVNDTRTLIRGEVLRVVTDSR